MFVIKHSLLPGYGHLHYVVFEDHGPAANCREATWPTQKCTKLCINSIKLIETPCFLCYWHFLCVFYTSRCFKTTISLNCGHIFPQKIIYLCIYLQEILQGCIHIVTVRPWLKVEYKLNTSTNTLSDTDAFPPLNFLHQTWTKKINKYISQHCVPYIYHQLWMSSRWRMKHH